MEIFGSVILGWILGISGTFVIEYTRKGKKKRALITSLRVELVELRYKIALLLNSLSIRLGKWDKEVIERLSPIILSYDGVGVDMRVRELFKKVSEIENKILKDYSRLQKNLGHSKALIKYDMPYFKSQINLFSLLKMELQRNLYGVNERLNIINQDIDQYWYYFEKTFDSSINESNHKKIVGNMELCFDSIYSQSQILIDKINLALDQLN